MARAYALATASGDHLATQVADRFGEVTSQLYVTSLGCDRVIPPAIPGLAYYHYDLSCLQTYILGVHQGGIQKNSQLLGIYYPLRRNPVGDVEKFTKCSR